MRSNAIGETTGTRRTRRISGASSQAAMVYIENWDDFQARSSALFRSDPVATRYVMKYRHCDGKLVLKVTDDKVCLKFKTDQAQDIRKMEKLNNTFFSMMARGPDAEVPEDLPKELVAPPPSKKGRGRRQ
nr:signal recognition particle 9 kDa protein-like isoform X1 [Physcomitrium patens]|eukprot:XP_024393965.1 signal recognition particle 9 kDa protein-like isoform X1 [Physcomitrella patens]